MNLRNCFRPLLRRAACAALAAGFIAIQTTGASAASKHFEIDPDHFSVGFKVMHIGYENMLGMFLKAEGELDYDEATKTLSNVRIVIETGSVFTNHKRRDNHLRSPDFLNADEFPEMVFTASSAEMTGDNTATVAGELELLGQSHPLTLELTLNKAADYPFGHGNFTLGISASGSFKRSTFGMTYGVDNGLVGDDIELILEFEAVED